MSDNHRVIEEPCEEKFSRTVLESGGSRERVADFNFIDLDLLPKFCEKPEGWQPSGQRVKRGLYRTLEGLLINADCNGAGNIGRKVAATLEICLKEVSRGALITPLKVLLWS